MQVLLQVLVSLTHRKNSIFFYKENEYIEYRKKRCVFSRFLKMGNDSAVRIELGRSFHQMGTVNEKVSESDFVPLWDGIVMRRSLAEHKLLEGI